LECLCPDAFIGSCWHLTGSRVCWFGVQFSREQARKDPDNYFNLRSDMCATQALHSFFAH